MRLTLGTRFYNSEHEMGKAAIDANFSHYTGMSGFVGLLREAASQFVADKYGIHYCRPEDEYW